MERRSASSIRLTSASIRSLRRSTSSRLLPMAERSMRRPACACLRTSAICSSITPPSAWWRRRRCSSATCWKVRMWNGGRSSTSVRCSIQTSRPATTAFACLRATTVGVWNEEGDAARLLDRPGVLPDELVSRACARSVCGTAVGGLPVPRPAGAARSSTMTLEARVGERTRIARELHDTLLQSFHGLLLRFQTASYLLPDRPAEAKEQTG